MCCALSGGTAAAQLNFHGLTAGQSTRSDVERVFGRRVAAHSETLVEYRPTADARAIQTKVYVQYRPHSTVVERIEVLLVQPFLRASVLEELRFPAGLMPALTRINPKGMLEEYYGAPHYVVVTYARADTDSGVARTARYSRELFERAVGDKEARP
jgi:hypothetical protein